MQGNYLVKRQNEFCSKSRQSRLGEILRIQNGYAFESELFNETGNGMPIVRIRDLARGNTDTFYSGEFDPRYIVKAGDFLIGMDGEFRCYRWMGSDALLNQRVCRLQEFSVKALPEYIAYGINKHLAMIEAKTHFATVKHLSSKQIEKIQISLPPRLEQERIVRILDKAEELRKLRAQADRRTADLIPAIFHDLFGDSVKNPKGWESDTVASLAVHSEGAIRTGPFGSDLLHSEFVTEGIPVLGIDNVVMNEFRWTAPRCIPLHKYEKFRRFRVYAGDVLVTIMGTVGRSCVAPHDLPECISTKHLCVITPDREKIESTYLWGSLLFDETVRQQTRSAGGGAVMEGWNSTIINRLSVRVPPISLQREFAARVAEIRTMEARQATSRRRLDDLFQSVLHQAFRGEL